MKAVTRVLARSIAVAVLAVPGLAAPAAAQDCAALYRAIRAEARDCGFFCDQAAIAPLQVKYEQRCIAPVPAVSTAEACGPVLEAPARRRAGEIRRRLSVILDLT